jgi:HEAT repeat protein
MRRFARLILVFPALISAVSVASAQQAAPSMYEDVVRNLRNPDQKVRLSAVRLLREAQYAEAMGPITPLINDPVNDIQLEAIGAELGFFLVEPVPAKKRVAFLVEVRGEGTAPAAFEMGPLAVWPKAAPPELVHALLKAVDDDNARVRVEAIYTLGVIARRPLPGGVVEGLIKAVDHFDPAIRTGAARVIGRLQLQQTGDALLKAVNDSNAEVRYAAMRALGDVRDARAVQALTEQFNYYGKGEGASAALEALSRIAHPSSVELFKSRLTDKDPHIRRAATEGLARSADPESLRAFETGVNHDDEEMVRVAMAFAMYKSGHPNYLGRMIDSLDSDRLAPQIQGYMMELGPSVVQSAIPRLREPDESVRKNLAAVLGMLGDQSTVAALTPLTTDRDRTVASTATHAIERINMSRK